MTRLLLTGDTHLGKGAHLYPGRLADQEAAWAATLELARARECDAVLHAGDLFDSRRPSPEALVAAERPLAYHRALDACPVHVIAGNHDIPALGGACGLDVLAEAGLVIAWREPGDTFVGGAGPGGGVWVGFLPWAPVSRLVAELAIDDRDEVWALGADVVGRIADDLGASIDTAARMAPKILVGHWSVTGASLPSGLPVEHVREVIVDRERLEAQGWAAVVLGHIHRPGNVAGSPTVFYTGSPICLDHGEAGVPHGVLVYDVEADTLERVELEAPAFVTLEGHEHEAWKEADVAGNVVRVRGAVTAEAAAGLDYAGMRAALASVGALAADLQITVERPERVAGAAAELELEAREQLGAWLEREGHDRERVARLLAMADPYLEQVRA